MAQPDAEVIDDRETSHLKVERLFAIAQALLAKNDSALQHAGVDALRAATDAWNAHYARFVQLPADRQP